jgi:hypothetical protein
MLIMGRAEAGSSISYTNNAVELGMDHFAHNSNQVMPKNGTLGRANIQSTTHKQHLN